MKKSYYQGEMYKVPLSSIYLGGFMFKEIMNYISKLFFGNKSHHIRRKALPIYTYAADYSNDDNSENTQDHGVFFANRNYKQS
jgi:hypothetical protein